MTVELDATLAANRPPATGTLAVTDTLAVDDTLTPADTLAASDTLPPLATHAASDPRAPAETLAGSAPLAASGPRAGLPRSSARIGRFRVERELGRGTMGVVYLAHDEELGRRVAIKLLQHGSDLEETRVRLLHEAKALARVNHPNIVAVHEVGLYGGQVYVAMEFVAGEALDAWIAARRPHWRDVLGVFRQAGEGLAAAHAVGLVHRDFKPANCILGDDGRVRVLDFGVARRVRTDRDDPLARSSDPTLTRGGRLVGSPAYMAAELFAGARADARSDPPRAPATARPTSSPPPGSPSPRPSSPSAATAPARVACSSRSSARRTATNTPAPAPCSPSSSAPPRDSHSAAAPRKIDVTLPPAKSNISPP